MERCVVHNLRRLTESRFIGVIFFSPSDLSLRGRMASIMVTTYTLKLLDEAEKQAKVREKPSTFQKKFSRFEKSTTFRFIETCKFDAEARWETSQLRNMAIP
jgi:hypothetical protein